MIATAFAKAKLRMVGETDCHQLVDRRLYDEIGEFLFNHGLSPTPAHFEVAHAYLAGADTAAAHAVAAMIAAGGEIDRERFAALSRPADEGPRALAVLADRLEAQLADCLAAADRSHSSARDYGDALDVARGRLDADPAGTLAHVAGLTRQVVATTRLVESQLNETRRETERLRGDLDQARDAAERDHLTGLPNRRGFEARIAGLDGARPVAVALCDIDDFKRVNDEHGHQTGDRVLRFVGSFLATELGNHGYVARHGGEEFAILLDGRTPDDAAALLDEIRARLALRSLVNQDTRAPIGHVTFSAGVAALGDDAVATLAAADAALYRAKHAGKNNIAAVA